MAQVEQKRERRTRTEMTASTRAALIALARQHFGERGFGDASLEDVTTAAQLTRGALYHHFGSKAGLFCAVVDDIDAEIDRKVASRLDGSGTLADDPWQRLRLSSHAYLDMVIRPDVGQIILRDAPNHYPDFGRRPIRLHCHVSTVEILTELIGQNRLSLGDAEGGAYLIEGAVAGLARWASDFGVPRDRLGTMLDNFLDSLAV